MTRTHFITGGTGYLGSYVIDHLLRAGSDRLALLVRGKDRAEAERKLWRALQLHLDGPRFWEALGRIDFVLGDVTAPRLGLDEVSYRRLVRSAHSVLHIAASLNRRSARECLDVNLRGTLAVVKLARAIADRGGLHRFSEVSTTAVAGKRAHETLREDEMVEWSRSDYDPYARTKKFGEHMVHELLGDQSTVVFRPSSVVGDSRRPETSQFDMARMCLLSEPPVLPLDPSSRLDIVNADWVGRAIATLHTREAVLHDVYNLSSGESSSTVGEITRTLARYEGRQPPWMLGRLERPMSVLIELLNAVPGKNQLTLMASLLEVFWPYMTFDTVFENDRAVAELGEAPVPFTEYCGPMYSWIKRVGWKYPYRELPSRPVTVAVPRGGDDREARI